MEAFGKGAYEVASEKLPPYHFDSGGLSFMPYLDKVLSRYSYKYLLRSYADRSCFFRCKWRLQKG